MAVRRALAFIVCCVWWSPAFAQWSQPLFLEAARDPGRADAAPTARALAMGDLTLTSTGADSALSAPAMLLFGSKTDIVVSFGTLRYARDELVATPARLPPILPGRRESPGTNAWMPYIAFAARSPVLAAGAFYDGTSRLTHSFESDETVLETATVSGQGYSIKGQGAALTDFWARRIGGSVAVTPWRGRLAIGAAAYATRVDYTTRSEVDVQSTSIGFGPISWVRRGFDRDVVDLHAWGVGYSLNVAARAGAHVTLSARWRHEPEVNATRVWSSEWTGSRLEQPVAFNLPDTYGAGAVFDFGPAKAAFEVARSRYADVFTPAGGWLGDTAGDPHGDPHGLCSQLSTVFCSGWAFVTHRPSDATRWSAGVEHTIGGAGRALLLRGGVGHEQAYTLARSATDPYRNRQTPAIPSVTDFEPPREAATWFSAGAGYRASHIEIGAGAQFGDQRFRFLADVRVMVP